MSDVNDLIGQFHEGSRIDGTRSPVNRKRAVNPTPRAWLNDSDVESPPRRPAIPVVVAAAAAPAPAAAAFRVTAFHAAAADDDAIASSQADWSADGASGALPANEFDPIEESPRAPRLPAGHGDEITEWSPHGRNLRRRGIDRSLSPPPPASRALMRPFASSAAAAAAAAPNSPPAYSHTVAPPTSPVRPRPDHVPNFAFGQSFKAAVRRTLGGGEMRVRVRAK